MLDRVVLLTRPTFKSIANPSPATVAKIAESNSFLQINQRGEPSINQPFPVTRALQRVTDASELIGFDDSRIALVGMGRWHMQIFNITCPFQQRVVYSAVYLNTQLTVENEILFPCKTVMEDIDFQNLCFEKGMHVIKTNEFIHTKLNWTPNTTLRCKCSISYSYI